MIMWEMKMTRALHGSCPGRGSRPTLLSCREGLCHQPRLLVGVSSAPAARSWVLAVGPACAASGAWLTSHLLLPEHFFTAADCPGLPGAPA